MARNSEKSDEKQQQTEPVLVLVKRAGPYRVSYNRPASEHSAVAERTGPGAVESVVVQLPPGLGLVPAEHWPHVKAEERFQLRVAHGQVKVLAGDSDTLAEGWAKLPQADAVAYLERSGDVPTLELLRDLEGRASRPRRNVAEAIDAALERVEATRRKLQEARKTQRQLHRTAAW